MPRVDTVSEEIETDRARGEVNIFEVSGTASRGYTTSTNRQNVHVAGFQAAHTPRLRAFPFSPES